MTKRPHWTQTPEGREKLRRIQNDVWGRKKRGEFKKIAKDAVKTKRKYTRRSHVATSKPMSLVINGWRVTLDKDEVRIEHE